MKNITTITNRQSQKMKMDVERGFAALLTILVIGAATLIMAYNASLLGLGELDLGYTSQRGGEALGIADGCIEDSLQRIRFDSNYAGGYITMNNGSCIINVSINGNDRTVLVTASSTEGYYKKIEANVTLPIGITPMTMNKWEEKED
jgi:hypothetical protein